MFRISYVGDEIWIWILALPNSASSRLCYRERELKQVVECSGGQLKMKLLEYETNENSSSFDMHRGYCLSLVGN